MNPPPVDSPSIDQQRTQALEHGVANLEQISPQVEAKTGNQLQGFETEQQESLKIAIAREVFKVGGEQAKVDIISFNAKDNKIYAQVNGFHDITVDLNTALTLSTPEPEKKIVDQSLLPIQDRRFATMDAAVADVLIEITPLSISENREYAGMICRDPEGQVFATKPVQGSLAGANPSNSPCPVGTTIIGDYHSHGNYSDTAGSPVTPDKDQYDSLNFSPTDYQGIAADGVGIPEYSGYLSTPDGTIKKYEPSTGTETIYNPATGQFE